MPDAAAHLERVTDVLRRLRGEVDAVAADEAGDGGDALGWQDAATDWLAFAVELLEDRVSPYDHPRPPEHEEPRTTMPDEPTTTPDTGPFEGWVILELMGHRRLAGYLREQQLAGAGFLRLDVPDPAAEDGGRRATQFSAPSAVYCITPTTEAFARRLAAGADPGPVKQWELPAPRATAAGGPPEGYWDPDDEEDLDARERARDAGAVP